MIKPLTSLRFFFALFVFLSHLMILSHDQLTAGVFKNVFSEGFLGVSFFFILSGFILSLTYKTKLLERNVTLKQFFVARFARIYPVHIVTMLIAVPLHWAILKEVLPYHLLLIQSFVPSQNIYFSLNAPSWSISNEMFFYALFPFLIFFFFKLPSYTKIIMSILMTLTVIIINIVLDDSLQHYWLYISPLTRIFDFIVGILLFDLCFYLKMRSNSIKINFPFLEVVSIGIFLVFFFLHEYVPISYRYSVYYWIPMVLIILAASQEYITRETKGIFNYILSSRILVYLGEISFCFYMLHKLVISYVRGLFKYFNFEISPIIIATICFILTIMASILTFEKLEKPLNRKIKAYFT